MIIDDIKNFSFYSNLGNRIFRALSYLKENDFNKMQDGKYEIDGNNVYAVVSRYETKQIIKGVWESHKKYIDVQFVADGEERIGYSNIENMKIINEYVEDKDIQFLSGTGDFLLFKENTFLILFPHDVHMPGIIADKLINVLKVVVKVKIE